jgi:cell division septum initiation protein DivIVA
MTDQLTQEDLEQMLAINSDLETEFENMAASYGRLAYLFARSCDTLRQSEAYLDNMYATLYFEAKKELGHTCKEAEAKSWIVIQDEYKEAVRSVNEAKYTKDVMQATRDALAMKKEMLQQLGPLRRGELGATIAARNPYKKHTADDANTHIANTRKKEQ